MERVVINRPKPLMGLEHVYHISDKELVESYSGDESKVDAILLEYHPDLKEIKTVRHGGWIYKGVVN